MFHHVLGILIILLTLGSVACSGSSEKVATCTDGMRNGDEQGVDCGGPCRACEPTCTDDIQNGDEEGVDCGGVCAACPDTASCDDDEQNGEETGVDCGGACDPCSPGANCGDGEQNGDEEGIDCGGSCAEACATCSDGVLNGDEQDVDCGGACTPCPSCTDGVQNGDEAGADCGGSCAVACPTCLDGMQNGDETGVDCGGSCTPCVDCVPDAKRLFVTSREYRGTLDSEAALLGLGDSLDGLAAGDALCTMHADSAGLGGTWRAWLSGTGANAIDRLQGDGPWYQVDRCTRAFESRATLLFDGPEVDLRVNENNTEQSVSIWSGTDQRGQADLWHCGSWTGGQSMGSIGLGYSPYVGGWTEGPTRSCGGEAALLCFEE